MTERSAEVKRATSETKVSVNLLIDGSGETKIGTGVAFFDHMLDQLGRHSGFDLSVEAQGDLQIDAHHTVEDVGITLGEALDKALGDKRGIRRYGFAIVPMEESLAQVALDLSGRSLLMFDGYVPAEQIGSYDPSLTEEFFHAFGRAAGITLHIKLLSGKNAHHMVEAVFKAVARALAMACEVDPRRATSVPSTKGVL